MFGTDDDKAYREDQYEQANYAEWLENAREIDDRARERALQLQQWLREADAQRKASAMADLENDLTDDERKAFETLERCF